MKTTSVSMKSNWKSLSIGTVIVLLIFTNTDISVLETFLFAYNATPAWVTGIVFLFPASYCLLYARKVLEPYYLIVSLSYIAIAMIYFIIYIDPAWWQELARPIFRTTLAGVGIIHTGLFVYLNGTSDIIEVLE